jgi:hypothetical protein
LFKGLLVFLWQLARFDCGPTFIGANFVPYRIKTIFHILPITLVRFVEAILYRLQKHFKNRFGQFIGGRR